MQKIKNLAEMCRIIYYNFWGNLNNSSKEKINTFIVGTQKGGTSALFDYLKKSPQVAVGRKKEMGFFSREKVYKRGTVWYSKQFKGTSKTNRLLDATPEYLYYPFVPERIYKYNPEAKIIIVLREPVSRAFSHYTMFRNISEQPEDKKQNFLKKMQFNFPVNKPLYDIVKRKTFPSFSDIIEQELGTTSLQPSFVKAGQYFEQVKRYYDLFSAKNILILESSELKNNKEDCVKRTAGFLGISTKFLSEQSFETKHVGHYKEVINEDDRVFLEKHYRPFNEKLYTLIGRKFDW